MSPVSIDQLFVIGVDDQLVSTFATWKQRGINTVVRANPADVPDGTGDGDPGDFVTFDTAATSNGLRAIRFAHKDATLDAGSAHLLALTASDEPEMKHCLYQQGVAAQQALKDAAAVSGLPFFTNYVGDWIEEDPPMTLCQTDGPTSADYCGIKGYPPNYWCYGAYFTATDWIAFDVYPMNRGKDIHQIANVMTRIAGSSTTYRPRLAYVEASDAHCDGVKYPNQWHVVFQSMEAVIAGARGIIYFPEGLNGCPPAQEWDNTTTRIQEEMTRLNLALGAVPGPTMNGAVDPADIWFESGAGANGVIKSGTRKDAAFAYYFTENDNSTTAYTHNVRFHGISNCLGKTVTAMNDTIVSNSPYAYADRTFTLDQYCQTTVPETWSAYRWKIYRVAIA